MNMSTIYEDHVSKPKLFSEQLDSFLNTYEEKYGLSKSSLNSSKDDDMEPNLKMSTSDTSLWEIAKAIRSNNESYRTVVRNLRELQKIRRNQFHLCNSCGQSESFTVVNGGTEIRSANSVSTTSCSTLDDDENKPDQNTLKQFSIPLTRLVNDAFKFDFDTKSGSVTVLPKPPPPRETASLNMKAKSKMTVTNHTKNPELDLIRKKVQSRPATNDYKAMNHFAKSVNFRPEMRQDGQQICTSLTTSKIPSYELAEAVKNTDSKEEDGTLTPLQGLINHSKAVVLKLLNLEDEEEEVNKFLIDHGKNGEHIQISLLFGVPYIPGMSKLDKPIYVKPTY